MKPKSPHYLLFALALFCVMGASLPWPLSAILGPRYSTPSSSEVRSIRTGSHDYGFNTMDSRSSAIRAQAPNLDPHVLSLALKAYLHAKQQGVQTRDMVTIIDYSKPSTERRLWVIDLHNSHVLYNTWVTHGKNSGALRATSFSDQPRSLKSSLGVFVTDDAPYEGGVGYALRLKGLESGFNSHAYQRAVVVHGAWYADSSVAKKYGQLGRSWGCPAVSPTLAKPLINTIKNHTLVFVYYPDRQWLSHSSFLA